MKPTRRPHAYFTGPHAFKGALLCIWRNRRADSIRLIQIELGDSWQPSKNQLEDLTDKALESCLESQLFKRDFQKLTQGEIDELRAHL